jgi:hypothetical protein
MGPQMEATGRLSRKWSPLLLVAAGGAIGAVALLTRAGATEGSRSSTAHTTNPDQTTQLKQQVDRLQQQVMQLQGRSDQSGVGRGRPETPIDVAAPPLPSPSTQVAGEPSLSEEELAEQTLQAVDRRYALLEKRFADEPFDTSSKAPEEQTVRDHIRALEGCELSKIECRSTMCRIEVRSSTASAGELFSQLGLREGGEVRRRSDGSFLIFAGREGFPFQTVNRVD